MSNPVSPDEFRALRTHRTGDESRSALETVQVADLSAGELLVRTRWAGVNYKDSLAVTGRAAVLEGSPRIAGIELVGTVERSAVGDFSPGDEVLVHGFGTGVAYDGGFSEFVRVRHGHAMRIPPGLDPWQAAVLGVPGFSVALALDQFESLGLGPDAGPVAVSGATGAVGLLAIAILSRLGYRTVALTRRADLAESLRALGAAEVIPAGEAIDGRRGLEKARFAAAIDNVGGDTLSWLLRSLQPRGLLASVGNASGNGFSANVLPFILRQVHLFGVVANAPWPVRERLWARLGAQWKPDFGRLGPHLRQIRLEDLHEHCRRQVAGATAGRTLVAFG